MKRGAWLCVPALACYALDVTLTLAGQPAAYWRGDYGAVQEANPLARWLLECSPSAFAGAALGWAVAFTLLLSCWRSRLAVLAALALTLFHAIGAATWLWPRGAAGKFGAVLVLVLARWLWALCWRRGNGPAPDLD
jgi:hypothetical protein